MNWIKRFLRQENSEEEKFACKGVEEYLKKLVKYLDLEDEKLDPPQVIVMDCKGYSFYNLAASIIEMDSSLLKKYIKRKKRLEQLCLEGFPSSSKWPEVISYKLMELSLCKTFIHENVHFLRHKIIIPVIWDDVAEEALASMISIKLLETEISEEEKELYWLDKFTKYLKEEDTVRKIIANELFEREKRSMPPTKEGEIVGNFASLGISEEPAEFQRLIMRSLFRSKNSKEILSEIRHYARKGRENLNYLLPWLEDNQGHLALRVIENTIKDLRGIGTRDYFGIV